MVRSIGRPSLALVPRDVGSCCPSRDGVFYGSTSGVGAADTAACRSRRCPAPVAEDSRPAPALCGEVGDLRRNLGHEAPARPASPVTHGVTYGFRRRRA